jgi:hypothetical protein
MENIIIKETWENASKGYLIGDSGIFETFTDDIGELFTSLQKEYGRCISKVYYDLPDGGAKAVGWVFQKRKEYDDCKDTFLLHTWVEVINRKLNT